MYKDMDIAVIGMSIRLTDIDKTDDFWKELIEGKDFINRIPQNRRKDVEDYLHYINTDMDKINWEDGTYLNHIDYFDNDFFDIPPKDASYMDPNQRLFLETAWHAIEDAGYATEKVKGTKTGVFVGYVSENDYRHMITNVNSQHASIAVPGNCPPLIAGRIGYILDLKGPNMLINTVCSSSLVAIHQACLSIKNEECEMAIAGGIQLHVLPYRQIKVGVESSSGKTMTFDNKSDGTGSGEGVGAVILKPLNEAVKDRDNIYAVIKGSGINYDGHSIGISAPNPKAQENLLVHTWDKAGVSVEDITMIEAHGTGTTLGDPIEIASINNAFCKKTDRKQFCGVGSVKSNVGHLDGAAGIFGFIKAVLCLNNKTLVPTINFHRPNTNIDFCDSSVYVIDRVRKWDKPNGNRLCGVSAFGFSGTNCHVLLAEAPDQSIKRKGQTPFIFTISAKTKSALTSLINGYLSYFNEHKDIDYVNVCYTSNIGRDHYTYRFGAMVCNINQLINRLEAYDELEDCSCCMYRSKSIYNPRNISRDDKKEAMAKYLQGIDINWKFYYKDIKCRKINLLQYPFKKTRHWIEIPQDHINRVNSRSIGNINEDSPNNDDENKEDIVLQDALIESIKNVCGFEEIDLSSSFLELGGDSIHAMNIAQELEQKYGYDIDPVDIIDMESLDQFIRENDVKEKSELSYAKAEYQYIPLTTQQERIYYTSKIKTDDIHYNMPYAINITGELDVNRLEDTIDRIIRRHEALRTSFNIINNKPMQKIHTGVMSPLEIVNCNEKSTEELLKEFVRPFELSKTPLARFKLINIDKNKYLFLMDIHHIICDGISTNIITSDFIKMYQDIKLPVIDINYSNLIMRIIEEKNREEAEIYWTDNYRNPCAKTYIPYDFQLERDTECIDEGTITKRMDIKMLEELKAFSKNSNVSMFELLFACFNLLIYTYSSSDDMVIGLNVSGRVEKDLYQVVGMFSNIIPFRYNIDKEAALIDTLMNIKDNLRNLYRYQNYPIEVLSQKSGINFASVVNIVFNMIHLESPQNKIKNLDFQPYYIKNRIINNDLTLDIFTDKTDLHIIANYKDNLYRKQTIEDLLDNYIELIFQMINNSNICVDQLRDNSITTHNEDKLYPETVFEFE